MDGLYQGCPFSLYLFILCTDTLSRALRTVVQGAKLEPYWSILGTQPLSHLLFTNDYLLIGQFQSKCKVLHDYY